MNDTDLNNEKQELKRPLTLTILCVLTFIFSGAGCLSALFTPMFADAMIELLKTTPNYNDAFLEETMKLLKAGWLYYIIIFILSAGSLTGAILMWKLKKIGIHFYALSNLGLLFVPILFLGMLVSWSGIMLTTGFIALYALQLKYMS